MNITITIQTGNAAMLDQDDVAQLLTQLADRIAGEPLGNGVLPLRDRNGNTVGTCKMVEGE
jgi:hypothetical protein